MEFGRQRDARGSKRFVIVVSLEALFILEVNGDLQRIIKCPAVSGAWKDGVDLGLVLGKVDLGGEGVDQGADPHKNEHNEGGAADFTDGAPGLPFPINEILSHQGLELARIGSHFSFVKEVVWMKALLVFK